MGHALQRKPASSVSHSRNRLHGLLTALNSLCRNKISFCFADQMHSLISSTEALITLATWDS